MAWSWIVVLVAVGARPAHSGASRRSRAPGALRPMIGCESSPALREYRLRIGYQFPGRRPDWHLPKYQIVAAAITGAAVV